MSKVFKFLESFGKSYEKKWSQIWKLLLKNGVKLPHKLNCFLANFALLAGFFGIGATIRIGLRYAQLKKNILEFVILFDFIHLTPDIVKVDFFALSKL